MTPKQKKLYDYLWKHRYDATPTYDEMAQHMGLKAKSGVHRMIDALVDLGHVRKAEGRRGLFVIPLPGRDGLRHLDSQAMIDELRARGFLVTGGRSEEQS